MRLGMPWLLAVLLLAGEASVAETTTPPKLRLGDAVVPVRQAVELTIVPAQESFTGTVEIELDVRASISVLWLNATSLKVHEANLAVGGRSIPARLVTGDEDVVGFAFDRPLARGPARLRVSYEGVLSRRDSEGLFTQQQGGEWYAFSQFEPLGARRAFPCFDEPGYKIPWRLTLRVRKDHVALANTPAASTVDGTGGLKAVAFAETRPLPSYLVAMAVGPFDLVDAGKAGRKGTPVRIVTPRGRAREARWAAEATPKIVTLLEDYFDAPFPYEKLDQPAIPVFFGAMENPGLVTYGARLILQKPEEETIRGRRAFASVCAHELAHQWFGDLVTMAWWDDLWLNESFASWMGDKITDRFRPEWEVRIEEVADRSSALQDDSLASARRIRQPIESKNDVANAFDGITYAKGEAVLNMFESWLGEEAFRKGVRRHLADHAWGNATAADFLGALSAEAGRDLVAPFSSLLDQTGAPLLTAQLECEGGGPPRLALTQRPYRPLGSRDASSRSWQVPVCARYGIDASVGRDCTLLTGPTGELTLTSAARCPDWVLANDGESGYYRVRYGGDALGRLLQDGGKRLTSAERVGLVGDIGALVASGDLSASDALTLVSPLAADANRQVVSSTIDVVRGLRDIVVEAQRPGYAALVRSLYADRARALGFRAKPDEDEEARLLRQSVISIVGVDGQDEALGAEAVKLAQGWLQDPGAVDPDTVGVILTLAAHNGDRALFDRFHEAAKKEQDPIRRARLLQALGSFRDPGIVRSALAVALEDGIDPRESISVVFASSWDPATRPLAYAFVKERYDALLERLPQGSVFSAAAYLPAVGGRFCDEERRADLEVFFKPRAARLVGAPRILDQILEGVDLCVAERRVQQTSVTSFLERYAHDAAGR